MDFLNSEKVRVFPYGQQRSTDPAGRLLNEENITRLVKSINDFDSYVVSYDKEKHNIEFVIAGYYITADLTDLMRDENGNVTATALWAAIEVVAGATTTVDDELVKRTYSHLAGADNDEDGTFEGVQFSTEAFKDTTLKQLQLLDENGEVPTKSFVRFNKPALGLNELLGAGDVISGGNATSANNRTQKNN